MPGITTKAERLAQEYKIKTTNSGVRVVGGTYDKKEKVFETSFFETDDFLFEQIKSEDSEHRESTKEIYIKYPRHGKEKIEYVESYKHNEVIYKPIQSKLTQLGVVLLPTDIEEYGTDDELVDDIAKFLYKYFELPKYYEAILPYLVMFYWVFDKFPFVPYLHFIGLTGTGKSTAIETIGSLCYKAINASGSITIASIFRLAHIWRGTLLMDEFNLGSKSSETYGAMLQILRGGVSDSPVFRVEGDRKKDVEVYQLKSPRVFSSQNVIQDAALQSRTIVIKMSKNTKKIPLYRLPNFYEESQTLRNKLLLWRLRHLAKIDLTTIEYGFEELAGFDGRVQQVLTPVYLISNEKTRKKIVEFAIQQEEDTKRERLEEIDGQVFMYIYENYKDEIMLATLTKHINDQREKQGYKNKYTERRLGNVVRKILGFDSERTNKGYRLVIKEPKVKELAKYYGLNSDVSISSVDSQHTPSSRIKTNTEPKKEKKEKTVVSKKQTELPSFELKSVEDIL